MNGAEPLQIGLHNDMQSMSLDVLRMWHANNWFEREFALLFRCSFYVAESAYPIPRLDLNMDMFSRVLQSTTKNFFQSPKNNNFLTKKAHFCEFPLILIK